MSRSALISIVLGAMLLTTGIVYYTLMPANESCDQIDRSAGRVALANGVQTSATFVLRNMQFDLCTADASAPQYHRLAKQFTLMKATHIKASSYALLNKVFFWLSLPLAIGVILLPMIHHHLKSGDAPEGFTRVLASVSNPVHLPAITLLAGLSFALYSDYKLKQTEAESLMKYIYFSEDNIQTVFSNVNARLRDIDRGHDFSTVLQTPSTEPSQ